jgi:hypothetical protein
LADSSAIAAADFALLPEAVTGPRQIGPPPD